jgi:hypothetical protein
MDRRTCQEFRQPALGYNDGPIAHFAVGATTIEEAIEFVRQSGRAGRFAPIDAVQEGEDFEGEEKETIEQGKRSLSQSDLSPADRRPRTRRGVRSARAATDEAHAHGLTTACDRHFIRDW